MTFAVLPVKDPRQAKQRLSGLLSPARREALARLMFEEMFARILAARGFARVLVATSDAQIAARAGAHGALVIEESEQHSHSRSADAAAAMAAGLGASAVVLLPIDVPTATAAEIDSLAAAAGEGIAIVPSGDGTGTNALVRTPPTAIESRFGPNSFQAHLQQARAKGLPVRVLHPPGIVFDVDTPEDVKELLGRAPECRAARFLREECGCSL